MIKDDVYAELILALWEAVTKLKYVENDGQCLRFWKRLYKINFMNYIEVVGKSMIINLHLKWK